MNLSSIISKKAQKQYQKYLKTQNLPQSSIDRKLASLNRFADFARIHYLKEASPELDQTRSDNITFPARTPQVPNFKKFEFGTFRIGKTITPYLTIAILVLFSTALGIFGYNQIFKDALLSQAYPQATSPTVPNRYFSFQARLTDSSDNPITGPTDMRFQIYNEDFPASGSAKLWEELRYIDPDQDGIFSVTLGTEDAMATSIFTENANLWLGVTVETDTEAFPRQRIATVGYALNAETLQGFPPSASASADQIPVLTQEGDLYLASASPVLYSSSGTFSIKGQVLTLSTAIGTNGDIQIAPDGTGNLDINLSSTTQNAINITNANQTSGHLISGYLGNDTATGDLINLSVGSTAVEKFTVDTSGTGYFAGNLGLGTTNPLQKLSVEGQCVTGDTLLPIISPEEGFGTSSPDFTSGRSPANAGASSEPSVVELTRIDQIKGGELVYSLNETTGKLEPQPIKGLLNMGVQPVYKLTTEDGKTITTTGNHPYLVKTTSEEFEDSTSEVKYTQWFTTSEVEWTKVIYLKEGQKIAVANKELFSQNVSVSKIQKNSHNSSSNIKQQQTHINIGETSIHDSTFLENSKPTLAQPNDSVNPTKAVNKDQNEKATSFDSNNLRTNEPNIILDKSNQRSVNFSNSNLDRTINNSLDNNNLDVKFSRILSIEYNNQNQTYKLTTEDGKTITTTGNHPYLVKQQNLLEKFINNNNSQENSNQSQGKRNNNISIKIPKIKTIHNNFLSSLNEISKQSVPNTTSIVNNNISLPPLIGKKLGAINTNPYQPADKLIANPDNALNTASLSFLPENNNFITNNHSTDWFTQSEVEGFTQSEVEGFTQSEVEGFTQSEVEGFTQSEVEGFTTSNAEWTKVIYLSPGDEIAVTEEGFGTSSPDFTSGRSPTNVGASSEPSVAFVKILSIEYVGEEQVWDIEVENTHNFVANGILAHNTYISGNVGVGTTNPLYNLAVVGTINATGAITGSNLSGTNTGDQLVFKTINASSGTDPVADTTTDTLNLTAGSNVTITGDSATDTITIASTNTTYTAANAINLNGTVFELGTNPLNKTTTITQAGFDMIYNLSTTGDFRIQDAGADVFWVGDNGNVGIGLTNPSSTLEVNGSIEVTNLYDVAAATGDNFFDGGCSATQTVSGIDSTGAITCTAITGVPASSVSFANITTGTNTQPATMVVSTGSSLNYASTGTINASSLVGATWIAPGTIGSTTPNTGAFTNLSSTGTTTIGNAIGDTVTSNAGAWTFANDTTVALTGGVNGLNFDSDTLSIDAANNRVGIGTAGPSSALHVNTTTTTDVITVGDVTNTNYSGIRLMSDESSESWIFTPGSAYSAWSLTGAMNIYNSNGPIAFQTGGGNNRMVIDATGNVGIGTISPVEMLQIGDGSGEGIIVSGNAWGLRLMGEQSGKQN
ncbi:MAG: hypothetical protein ABII08_00220, partial [Candidatus Beckwithbacteria bacterium]